MTVIESNRLVSFGLVVLIWLVQLVIYPSFAWIDHDRFRAWHLGYTRAVTWIVMPLMLAQVALLGILVFSRPGPWNGVAAGMVGLSWLATFTLAVPAHERLQAGGADDAIIRRLVATNWIRTLAWTTAFLVSLPG